MSADILQVITLLGTSCVTNAEAWFNKSLRPRKPEGSLGRTAQGGHLDSHTAPELWFLWTLSTMFYSTLRVACDKRAVASESAGQQSSAI